MGKSKKWSHPGVRGPQQTPLLRLMGCNVLSDGGWNGRRGQASEHHSSGSAGSGTATSPFSGDGSEL